MIARWATMVFFIGGCLWGCGEHVLGTHDVAIEYAVARPVGAPEVSAEVARDRVERRLGAASVGATVDVLGTRALRVIVDRAEAESVEGLIRWRGGIAFYRPLPERTLVPRNASGVLSRSVASPAGPQRVLEGSRERIAREVLDAPLPPGERAMAEFVDNETARAIVVEAPPLLDLSDGVARVQSTDGVTLQIDLTPGASHALEQLRARSGAAPLVLGRDRTALALRALPRAGPIVRVEIPYAGGIYAYSRVANAARLLRTETLPLLERTREQSLPVNWSLALASLLLPLALSFAWLFFVRRFDRARPEPLWLVMATFGLGALSVVPAGFAEWAFERASPYLNPTVMTLGGHRRALPLALAAFTLVVGASEECSKFVGAWFIARRRAEFDEPVDGLIYGAASSLGFAAVENVKYFAHGRLGAALVTERMFVSIPAHLFFGAIWGYALGARLVSPRVRVWPYLLWAACMHGAFDALLSIEHMGIFALALELLLAGLFVVFLQRSLRYGTVTRGEPERATGTRALFRMGSRLRFALYAVLYHLLAVLLFVQSANLEYAHRRVDVPLLVVSSVLLAALGWAAARLAANIPLDVVVDASGVTFAGAQRAWHTVKGVEPERVVRGGGVFARLHSPDGDLILGPTDPVKLMALVHAIDAGLAEHSHDANSRA